MKLLSALLIFNFFAVLLAQSCQDPSIDISNALPGPELLMNGDFESYGALPWWPSDAEGFTKDQVAEQCGQFSGRISTHYTRSGCLRPNAGLYQQVILAQEAPRGVYVSAYGNGVNVSGVADVDFSLYVDVTFTDGTAKYGIFVPFAINAKWNRQQLYINEAKAIQFIFVHLLFRKHTGTAYFDNVSVKEEIELVYPLGKNILSNPGFELGDSNWTQTGGATCEVSYSGNQYIRSGEGSLSLGAGTTTNCFTGIAQTIYFYPPITSKITFEAYVYISYPLNADSFNYVYIGITTNYDLGLSENVQYEPTNGWKLVNVSVVPSAPVTQATFSFVVQGKENGIAYDDASVVLSQN